jgi:hypothetical protein
VCVNLFVQIINNTFYLTSGITVVLQKIRKSRISPDFMQTEGSVPCSQQLITCSYHATDIFSPNSHPVTITYFNAALPITASFSIRSLYFKFSNKNSLCISLIPMRATCLARPVLLNFIGLITLVQGQLS